jgi:hypothetical protein
MVATFLIAMGLGIRNLPSRPKCLSAILQRHPTVPMEKKILRNENVPTHTALSIQNFMAKNKITAAPLHLLCGHCFLLLLLVSMMKVKLKQNRFSDVYEIQQNVQQVLNGIMVL